MILLTRMIANRTSTAYFNPALIEYIRVPMREDRTGRPMAETGAEIGMVSGEVMRVAESPDEVALLVTARPMLHPA